MIKSLIFDFDGLILDTETPEFHVWQAIYREHGQELAAAAWGQIVGGNGASDFDAASHLQELVGSKLDLDALRLRHRRESDILTDQQAILPGVIDMLAEARFLKLKCAVASSSPHSWVDAQLTRLGLFRDFDAIVCADDVPPGRTKPYPDLFLKTLDVLSVRANEAVVFEDSPNGLKAAKAAGIFAVAVPNPITALLKMDGADLTLKSLADLPLRELLERF